MKADSKTKPVYPSNEAVSSDASKLLERIQKKNPYPLNALFSVTERCNLSCRHCAVSHTDSSQEMDLHQIVELLDELADLGILFLSLTGGEPSLREDLEDIVAAAARRRFAVKLKTNASLLDSDRIKRLVEAGVHEVHVSIYHGKREPHDDFVGLDGAWDAAWKALDEFRRRGVATQVSSQVMSFNAENMRHLVDLCVEHGHKCLIDPKVSTDDKGNTSPCVFRPCSAQIDMVLRDERVFNTEKYDDKKPRESESKLCTAGSSMVYFRSNGDVMLCPFLPWVLGNVREKKFADIWDNSEERLDFVNTKWRDLPECSSCEISWACSRCPASALWESGSIKGISPADCMIARERVRVCDEKHQKRKE